MRSAVSVSADLSVATDGASLSHVTLTPSAATCNGDGETLPRALGRSDPVRYVAVTGGAAAEVARRAFKAGGVPAAAGLHLLWADDPNALWFVHAAAARADGTSAAVVDSFMTHAGSSTGGLCIHAIRHPTSTTADLDAVREGVLHARSALPASAAVVFAHIVPVNARAEFSFTDSIVVAVNAAVPFLVPDTVFVGGATNGTKLTAYRRPASHDAPSELHVFVGVVVGSGEDPLVACLQQQVSNLLPDAASKTETHGARIARFLNDALHHVGVHSTVECAASTGSFNVSAVASTTSDTSLLPIRKCPWSVAVGSVWPATDAAEAEAMEPWGDVSAAEAYVLEFTMDGLAGDAAALDAVKAQLAWGKGVYLEKRHGSAHERVTVKVLGPNRQVLKAETDLEEEHVGEEGAMLRVRADGCTVRLQFPPGVINRALCFPKARL
eukprot:CAMPEP_0174880276 /NCGR_PEP_ID=MMETSP1114-20130205/83681_1 /TAXON_ID=312471 /ORGANISM="Neobodo designis, Strain CCAP 1951/1" /LENGTH=439 /DNA_ID=CAMNT_0016115671 /DNA_START=655 /DNA_END=1974 /DNA_ORIENTATION=-